MKTGALQENSDNRTTIVCTCTGREAIVSVFVMDVALPPCYRCSFCGERDCCWKAPTVDSEKNHPWLLLPYPSPSIERFLRNLSLRRACSLACRTTSTSPLSMRLHTVAGRTPLLGRDSTSRVTGGNILHVLLYNFGSTYPEVIHSFISERIDGNSAIAILGTSQWSRANPPMLLQRDTFGNLPIHVALSVGVPTNVLLDLLLQTLKAQKSLPLETDRPIVEVTSCGTSVPHLHPYALSTNNNGYSLLDVEILRFMDDDSKFFYSDGPCYTIASHQFLRDTVDQIKSDGERTIRYDRRNGEMAAKICSLVNRPLISNFFLTRIKCIIFTAYKELQWLVEQSRKYSLLQKSPRCKNGLVMLDWFPGPASEWKTLTREGSSITESDLLRDNPYVLHHASALSGPTLIVNCADCSNGEDCKINRATTYLLQVSRHFLDLLLLEDDAVRACTVPYPETGQLPLHFAAQAGFVLFRNRHGSRRFTSDFRNRSNSDEWKEWIQKLIEIDPTTCFAKDSMNRIPLHYLLLRCLHHRYMCDDEPDMLFCCCSRKSFNAKSYEFLCVASCNCKGCCRSPVCTQDNDFLSEMIFLFIRSHPESIEIPCLIRFRTFMDPTDEGEGIGSTGISQRTITHYLDYSCRFEVYQVAAMAYPVVSLNTIYSLIRMCPSRCLCYP
jgi:hypothetical protein